MESKIIQQSNTYWVRLLAGDIYKTVCNYDISKQDKLKAVRLVEKAIIKHKETKLIQDEE